MPTVPIVVEGNTDEAFFLQIVQLLTLPRDITFQPQAAGGKSQFQEVVKALLAPGEIEGVVIAEDINAGAEGRIIQSHRDSISTFLGHTSINVGDSDAHFRVGEVVVTVIPMGLPNDPDLQALGITNHALEDYLIQLLLDDECLTAEIPRFRHLIEELIEAIRGHDVAFDSSKELFQLVKPIIKLGFSDTGVVEALFEKANPNRLRAVTGPLIRRLEQAAAP